MTTAFAAAILAALLSGPTATHGNDGLDRGDAYEQDLHWAVSPYQRCVDLGIPGALELPMETAGHCDQALISNDLNDEERAGALLVRAMSSLMLQQGKATLRDLDHAYDLSQSDPLILLGVAQHFERIGAYQRSALLLRWLRKHAPEHPALLRSLGHSYYRLDRPALAISVLDGLLERHPADILGYSLRAAALITQSNFEAALRDYNRAIEIQGDDIDLLAARASALFALERYDLAVEDLQKATATDNPDPYSLLLLQLSQSHLGTQLPPDLKDKATEIDKAQWPGPLFKLFEDPIEVLTLSSFWKGQTPTPIQLSESYYYLGHYHLLRGESLEAANYFRLTLETEVKGIFEVFDARAKLRNLTNSANRP